MRLFTALAIYRCLLPLLFVAAFPGWIVKMLRRGGFGTDLGERAAIFNGPKESEPCGAVHIHAVSVGEALLALKLIREWRGVDPQVRFVLATGTATGHAVATSAMIPELRVTYSPLDFPWMLRRYLNRFQPAQIILIEGEAWPNLLLACRKRKIPVALVNARISPRSARRFRRFAVWVRPVFAMLDAVAIQESEDAEIWRYLGVAPEKIHHTGSLKFDPTSGVLPARRPEFQQMLDAFGSDRPVVMLASSHAGEDAWISAAIREAAPQALPVIVPRHAERRIEVKQELERAGFEVVLRSKFHVPTASAEGRCVFVIDSTGELRDWTVHADAVIIGKSFLARGGQNPSEAIIAGKPVIFGPHMENFEPLASRLVAAHGSLRAHDQTSLTQAIISVLDGRASEVMTRHARQVLACHEGAARRIIELIRIQKSPRK